jgi:hypothetical protein
MQDITHGRSLDQGHAWARTNLPNDFMDNGGEQCCLIVEAMIEGALRDPRARRDRFDGRRPVALSKKELRSDL